MTTTLGQLGTLWLNCPPPHTCWLNCNRQTSRCGRVVNVWEARIRAVLNTKSLPRLVAIHYESIFGLKFNPVLSCRNHWCITTRKQNLCRAIFCTGFYRSLKQILWILVWVSKLTVGLIGLRLRVWPEVMLSSQKRTGNCGSMSSGCCRQTK
jgi:hypothetical protein